MSLYSNTGVNTENYDDNKNHSFIENALTVVLINVEIFKI